MIRHLVCCGPLRAGGMALALALLSSTCAKATTVDFGYTGSIVYYTVPTTGVYDITAYGAQGGVNTGAVINSGGLGVEAGGAFRLTAGETLAIVVGGQGGNGSGLDGGGGGGGGSFVALSGVPATYQTGGCSGLHTDACADTLLVAGGGGGGAGTVWSGIGGQTGNDGADAHLTGGGGALLGGGAGGGLYGGGGGGGYINDGLGGDPGNGCSGGDGCGGKSFEAGAAQYDPSLGTGGSAGGAGGSAYFLGFFISGGGAGGFGGGGGAGEAGAGGGGGGYSGGGGGDQGSAGGGGGSYLDLALLLSDETLIGNAESGNGLVVLSFVSPPAAPELSTWSMLAIGFAGMGYAGLRRKAKDRLSSAFN